MRKTGTDIHGEPLLEQVLLTATATCGEPMLEHVDPKGLQPMEGSIPDQEKSIRRKE